MLRSLFLRACTRRLSALFVVIALSACGGGGGGGSGGGFLPDSGGNTAPTPSFSVTVVGKNGQGEDSSKIAASDPLTIEVLVNDTSGSTATAVVGAIVELTSTLGKITPENASAITDSDGIAGFGIEFDGTEGAGTVTASFTSDGVVYSGTLNVESIREPARVPIVSLTLSALNTSGEPLTVISQRSPATIVASLRSEFDGVMSSLPGELVTLETDLGRVSPNNRTALTNSEGDALFTLEFDGVEGAGSVRASAIIDDAEYTDTINLEAEDTGPPFELTILTSDTDGNATSTVTSGSPLVVEVAVKRIDGRLFVPVGQGETVTLTSSIGKVGGNGSALTNAKGIAKFELAFDGTIGAGTLSASYASQSSSVTRTSNIQAIAEVTDYTLAVSAESAPGLDPQTFSLDNPVTIKATLSSSSGPTENMPVTLETTIGSVTPSNGATLTNAAGVATFRVGYNDVIGAGVATVSYMSPNGVVSANINLEAVALRTNRGIAVSSYAPDGSASSEFSLRKSLKIEVQLTNETGDPLLVGDELVRLSSTVGRLDAEAKLTNAIGIATFDLESTGAIGAGVLTATYEVGTELFREQKAVQSVSDTPFSISVSSSGNVLSVGQDVVLTVKVLDPSGNPVSGDIVAASSSLGRLDRDSALTDATGVALFTLSYDDQLGAGTVTFSYDSGTEVFSNSLPVQARRSSSPTLTILTQVGTTAGATQFDTSSDMSVTVQVSGSSDYSVAAGDTVSLSTTIGTVLGNGVALLVDNGGVLEATFTVSSNDEIGAGTLTASINVGDEIFEKTLGIESLGPPYRLSELSFKASNGLALTEAVLSSEVPNRTLTASVELTNLTGSPLPNRLIQFATAVGLLTPASGYVLTDASGRAEIAVEYSDALQSGIGLFTARYVSALGTIEQTADLQALAPDLLLGTIAATNFTEGAIDSSPASGNLVNQGSGVLRLDIVKGGLDINNASSSDRIKSLQTVAFDSFCLRNGLATLLPSSPVSTSSGELTVTYTAGASCTGEDEVVATLLFGSDTTNQTARQIFTIAVASEVVSLEFADLAPSLIAIKGTGDLVKISEQTQVRFRVVDVNGSPVQGEVVNLALSSSVGGLSLSSSSATSDAEGLILVTVSSGTLPAQTVVTAELASTGQLVSSDLITVSTGVPDQNSFTLSASILSVSQAYVVANKTSTIGVAVADRYNNVIPDGSLIYFTTEYGGIDPSCAINDGRCEVTWRSQNPWPTGANLSTVDCSLYDNNGDGIANNDAVGTYDPCPIPLGIEQGSRTTILATVTGEESFNDVDGDGLMSDFVNEFSDFAHDLGEPYLDENGSGSYQVGERFVDDNNDGSYDAGDDLFTGIGCSASTLLSGECTGSLLSVFDNIELIMSDSDRLYIALVDSDPVPNKVDSVAPGSYVAYISDQYNNRPATGAAILVEATGDCSILTPTSFTVGNSNRLGAFAVGIEIAGVANTPAPDSVSISVTNPGAPKVTSTFSCTP